MGFDFEGAEKWETSTDSYLPVGNHVVEITRAEGGRSRNGHPQITLEVGNALGTKKDWLVYSEKNGVSKVATLFEIAGVNLLNTDQDDTGALKEAKVAQLVGKKVGVVVREEPSLKDPSKMYANIKGYVPVEAIADAAPVVSASPSGVAEDDIPF